MTTYRTFLTLKIATFEIIIIPSSFHSYSSRSLLHRYLLHIVMLVLIEREDHLFLHIDVMVIAICHLTLLQQVPHGTPFV